MRLNKIIFILFIVFILFCSFASAFQYNGTECADSSDPAYILYNDSFISLSAVTNFEFTDISNVGTDIVLIYLPNWVSSSLGVNMKVKLIDTTTDGVVNIIGNYDTEWAYQGSAITKIGILTDANEFYNLSLLVDYGANSGYFALWNDDGEFGYSGDLKNDNPLEYIQLQNAGVEINLTGLYIWNESMTGGGCPLAIDTTPPQNSTWNATSPNVVGDTTAWNTKSTVTINSDLLSHTVVTDENSNGSCVLDQNWNYTYAVEQDPNYKFATTDTTSHAYTVYDNISYGTHCLYCSFIDNAGNEYANSSSGCLPVDFPEPPVYCPVWFVGNRSSGDRVFTVDCNGDVNITGNVTIEIADYSFQDRGDIADYDFNLSNLTADAVWHDLDLSSIVPAGYGVVDLHAEIKDDTIDRNLLFRKNGNVNTVNVAFLKTQVANIWIRNNFLVAMDSDRVVEYFLSNVTWSEVRVTVIGWWK